MSNDLKPLAYQCPDPLFQAITQLFGTLSGDVVVLPNVKMQFVTDSQICSRFISRIGIVTLLTQPSLTSLHRGERTDF